MARPGVYDYEKVWQKLKELYNEGKLNHKTIKSTDSLPTYNAIKYKIGGVKKLTELIGGGVEYDDLLTGDVCVEIPKICNDCAYKPNRCNENYRNCEKEATLYNELGDKNTVAEYLGAADFQLNNG